MLKNLKWRLRRNICIVQGKSGDTDAKESEVEVYKEERSG